MAESMDKSVKSTPLVENQIYTVPEAAAILHRSVATVRQLCRSGRIRAGRDRGGYLITGWMIRRYAEGILDVAEN